MLLLLPYHGIRQIEDVKGYERLKWCPSTEHCDSYHKAIEPHGEDRVVKYQTSSYRLESIQLKRLQDLPLPDSRTPLPILPSHPPSFLPRPIHRLNLPNHQRHRNLSPPISIPPVLTKGNFNPPAHKHYYPHSPSPPRDAPPQPTHAPTAPSPPETDTAASSPPHRPPAR